MHNFLFLPTDMHDDSFLFISLAYKWLPEGFSQCPEGRARAFCVFPNLASFYVTRLVLTPTLGGGCYFGLDWFYSFH